MHIISIEKYMWFAISIYWLATAFAVKKTVKRQSGMGRIFYILFLLFAFTMLFANGLSFGILDKQILPQNEIWKVTGLFLCGIGLLFALMARIWLGKNWSGRVTVKENHELIQSGPYSITRNPIYTGFLTAFAGCSMSQGRAKGYLSFIFMLISVLLKISQEEVFMQKVFGEKFTAYKSKVKRLIPFIY